MKEHAIEHKLSGLEKFMLRKFHPRKIFFDTIAAMWAVYFLWNQDWQRAILFTVAISLLGLLTVGNIDYERMSRTTLGKLALLHLHPFNFVTQIIGMVPLIYGIWTHSAELILGGLTLVLAGHAFGWEEVNDAFSTKTEV